MTVVDLCDAATARLMLIRAEYIFASARHSDECVIKFITRTPFMTEKLRACIRSWIREKKISFMIYGEKFSLRDEKTQFLLNHFPAEANDPDMGKENSFATIVCFSLHKEISR